MLGSNAGDEVHLVRQALEEAGVPAGSLRRLSMLPRVIKDFQPTEIMVGTEYRYYDESAGMTFPVTQEVLEHISKEAAAAGIAVSRIFNANKGAS